MQLPTPPASQEISIFTPKEIAPTVPQINRKVCANTVIKQSSVGEKKTIPQHPTLAIDTINNATSITVEKFQQDDGMALYEPVVEANSNAKRKVPKKRKALFTKKKPTAAKKRTGAEPPVEEESTHPNEDAKPSRAQLRKHVKLSDEDEKSRPKEESKSKKGD